MFVHVLHKFTKFVLIHGLVVHVVLLHVLPEHSFVFESGLAFGLDWVIQQTHHICQQLQRDFTVDVVVEDQGPENLLR